MSDTNPGHETATRRLRGSVVDVTSLDAAQRRQMFTLLSRNYANTDAARFDRDLDEKESVVLLCDRVTGETVGFSTLMRIAVQVDQRDVIGIFSGDTIIDPSYWGEGELSRTWLQHVFRLRDQTPEAQVYWFMIVSGHATYRFMPVHFKHFYPSYREPTPPVIQRRLDALALTKFPDEYDPRTGIVRPREASPVLPGVADVTEQRRRNPHVAFLVSRNPGYARGEEMACLAEMSHDNLTRVGEWALRAGVASSTDDAPIPGRCRDAT
jgi:hypothetical protein